MFNKKMVFSPFKNCICNWFPIVLKRYRDNSWKTTSKENHEIRTMFMIRSRGRNDANGFDPSSDTIAYIHSCKPPLLLLHDTIIAAVVCRILTASLMMYIIFCFFFFFFEAESKMCHILNLINIYYRILM